MVDGIEEWRRLGHEVIERSEAFLLFAVTGEEIASMYPVRTGTTDEEILFEVVSRYVDAKRNND